MSGPWSVRLFGTIAAQRGDRHVSEFRTRKTAALFAYLACTPGTLHRREHLIELLWPDLEPESARNCLSKELSDLRRHLELDGQTVIETAGHRRVGLARNAVVTDVEAAQDLIGSPVDDPEGLVADLESALSLASGELLPVTVATWAFDAWRTQMRDDWRKSLADARLRLADGYRRLGRSGEALDLLRETLRADPMDAKSALALLRELEGRSEVDEARQVAEMVATAYQGHGLPLAPAELAAAVGRLRGSPAESVQSAGQRSRGTQAHVVAEGTAVTQMLPIIRAWEGHVISTDDGRIVMKFARVSDAAEAVWDAARMLPEGQSLRVGLHVAGTPPASDNGDVPIDIAARLVAHARPGEWLASEPAESLLRYEAQPPFNSAPHDLATFGGQLQRIFRIWHASRPTDSTVANRGIPVFLNWRTSFVGRDSERASLVDWALGRTGVPGVAAAQPGAPVRLVTLTGVGGIGKSRLAAEVIAEVNAELPGSGAFVPFRPAGQASDLIFALADTLNVDTRDPDLSQIEEALRRKRVIVLDNLEHVPEASRSLILDILARTRDTRVLATSRVALDPEAGVTLRLTPLTIPEDGDTRPGSRVEDNPSVQLFDQRARQANPQFDLRHHRRDVVVLCRLLAGLPLALELAGAWAKSMTPGEMIDRIRGAEPIAPSDLESSAEIPASLDGALAWSFKLLPAEAREFLCRLSIFRGGFTLKAAKAVTATPLAADHLHLLHDASWINAAYGAEAIRYDLLEPVREYLSRQLEPDVRAGCGRRHLAYYRDLADEVSRTLAAGDRSAGIARLGPDASNVRHALRSATTLGALEDGLRLAGSMWRYWYSKGEMAANREVVEDLIARARSSEGHFSTHAVARTHKCAGILAYGVGDYAAAKTHFERCLSLFKELDKLDDLSSAYNNLGLIAQATGKAGQAEALYLDSLEALHAFADGDATDDVKHRIATTLSNLAGMAVTRGDYAVARERAEESQRLFAELGDAAKSAVAGLTLATSLDQQGNREGALLHLRSSLAVFRKLDDQRLVASALQFLGYAELNTGDADAARECLEESLAVAKAISAGDSRTRALDNLGLLYLRQKQPQIARRVLGKALQSSSRETGPVVDAKLTLAMVACFEDAPDEARSLVGECLTFYRRQENVSSELQALDICAMIERLDGRVEAAGTLRTRVDSLRLQLGIPRPPTVAWLAAAIFDESGSAEPSEQTYDRTAAPGWSATQVERLHCLVDEVLTSLASPG